MKKKRLKGHKTPLERMNDIFVSIAVDIGALTYEEIDAIKSKEYSLKERREAKHSTSIRSVLNDNFKDKDSLSSWGKKLIPEGIDNISARELVQRLKDAMLNPVHYHSKKRYKIEEEK